MVSISDRPRFLYPKGVFLYINQLVYILIVNILANLNTNGIRTLLVKGIYATGAGVLAEFLVDFFRIPMLTGTGLFGGSGGISNYEVIVYALSTGGAVAGIMDYFSNSKPLGFSKEFLPYFIGFGFGTSLYESLIADKLGLRNINPYQIVYNAVPNIPLL